MKTKIVYVLVSDENDFYLEQTFISVYSARMHNKDAEIVLVTDALTSASCKSGLRKNFLEFFNEINVVETNNSWSKLYRSRDIKTNLRKHLQGDFLYVDGDTVICDSLDGIDEFSESLLLTLDMHLNDKKAWAAFINPVDFST